MDKYVGKRLDGRYEIREIVGEGGMARVYKAYDNQENRLVAIKILKEEFLSNDEFLRRFKNESKAIAMLSHPNIVNVYDVSFGDLIQYIVMEYIEGITLKEYIENQGSLRWKDAVHFAMQILKGLQHAHDKGIVHRDVKPQNIMVLSDGTIKVTDFGIARFSRSDQATITDKAIGSVHYISPEQARGEKTDEKADIYSVGVMLYEMLTGKLPFQAESAVSVAIMQLQRDPQRPTEINASIPLGLEQITMHAMQKNRDKRYQSASELLCDLGNFKKDPAITFPYNYFVDDSPTKFVGGMVLEGDDSKKEKANDIKKKEKVKTKRTARGGIVAVLTGVAIALIIAIIVLCIIFLPKFIGKIGGKNIEVPNFVGMKYEDIKNNKEYDESFDFTEPTWNYNSEYAHGYVYKQSITAGNSVKEDAEITLYVSMGAKTKKVNNVVDKLEVEAVSELRANGFNVVVTEMASEKYDKGHVIRTEPERGAAAAEGTTVTVFVSTGKPTVFVSLPDVEGEPLEQAKKKILAAKLMVTEESIKYVDVPWDEKYQPEGNVLYIEPVTEPNASGKVAEGSEITVYVSSGKFTADLKIRLPLRYGDNNCKVSIWCDGVEIKSSELLDITTVREYTFTEIASTKKVEIYTVKIKCENTSYVEYKTYKVNYRAESHDELMRELQTGSEFGG